MSDISSNGLAERISVHDTEIQGIKGQLNAVFSKLDHIETLIGESKKTNWGLIVSVIATAFLILVAGIGALVAYNAASVTPLDRAILRQEETAKILAAAVVEQNKTWASSANAIEGQIHDIVTTMKVHDALDSQTRIELERVEQFGSASADKRLTLLERGDPQLEKRLTILEYQMSHPRKKE